MIDVIKFFFVDGFQHAVIVFRIGFVIRCHFVGGKIRSSFYIIGDPHDRKPVWFIRKSDRDSLYDMEVFHAVHVFYFAKKCIVYGWLEGMDVFCHLCVVADD